MRRIVKASAFAVVIGVMTTAAAEPQLQISYPTDGAMTCGGLDTEIARMDTIMGVSNEAAAGAAGSARAAEAGASVAVNAALYSGALGKVPGLGAFGNAAAGFAKKRAAAKEAEAKETMRTAETRRAMLMGIYQGKNCAAVVAAEAQVAPAVEATPGGDAGSAPEVAPAPAAPAN